MMVLLTIGVNGVTAGRPGVAAEATEGLALAGEAGLPNAVSIHRAVLAWVAAVKGEDERCRAYAAEVAASARPAGAALAGSIAEWGLALLDLGAGRLDETVARLSALREAPPGLIHPLFVLLSAADLVEACVRSGRDEEAAGAYAVLEGFARPGAPAWALALAARCRALLGRDAEAAFAEALRAALAPLRSGAHAAAVRRAPAAAAQACRCACAPARGARELRGARRRALGRARPRRAARDRRDRAQA